MQSVYQVSENKLQVKLKECEFGKAYVEYFGHIVELGELCVDIDKVAAVRDWAPPVDIKGV